MTHNQNADTEFVDVMKFHVKFGQLATAFPRHLTQRKLGERINFMFEELKEFAEAAGFRQDITHDEDSGRPNIIFAIDDQNVPQDIALQADALVDLVYVAKGTAVMMGLPWEELWDDVQGANMRKVRGMTHRGNLMDVSKPPGWVGPRTMEILQAAGYAPPTSDADYAEDEVHR